MVTLLFLGTELISSSGVRAEGRWLVGTWPCVSVPLGEAAAASLRAKFALLSACTFWSLGNALSPCLWEEIPLPMELGHQQAVTRIADKCLYFLGVVI